MKISYFLQFNLILFNISIGIIRKGGDKPNIIPEFTEMSYILRAPTVKELEDFKKKAIGCFEAAATATGCRVKSNIFIYNKC